MDVSTTVCVVVTAGRVSVKKAVDVSVIMDVSKDVLETVTMLKISCVCKSVVISVMVTGGTVVTMVVVSVTLIDSV